MPADFFIDAELGVVFSKASGVLTWADVLDHMDRLLRHPRFHPKLKQLSDFREVTETSLSGHDIRMLANRNIFRSPSKRAFVMRSEVHFGLGRMFASYRQIAGEEGIVIFSDMAEALSWLSLSAEPDPRLFTRLISMANEA